MLGNALPMMIQSIFLMTSWLHFPLLYFHACLFVFTVCQKEWKRTQMEDFAKMSAEFRQDLEQPESKTRIATYESFYQQDGGRPLMP